MENRYKQILVSKREYYQIDCPVDLSAYAILRDVKEDMNLLQLKFRNCSSNRIIGIVISATAYDQLGEESERINRYQYADVNADSGDFFGSNNAIKLVKDTPVKRISVFVNNVLYSSGEIWESLSNEELIEKKPLHTLSEVLSNDLAKEYDEVTGHHMKYIPQNEGISWTCACGAHNYNTEICCGCKTTKQVVFGYYDAEYLSNSVNKKVYDRAINEKKNGSLESIRHAIQLFECIPEYKDSTTQLKECLQLYNQIEEEIEKENKRREEENKRKEEKEILEKRKKKENTKRNVTAVAVVLMLIAVATLISTYFIIPYTKYKTAVMLQNNGNYEEAITVYKELDGYKDSVARIEECESCFVEKTYVSACELMEKEKYDEAYGKFKTISKYKDSSDKINECRQILQDIVYNTALSLMEEEKYDEAIERFETIRYYKDSNQKINECKAKIDGKGTNR